MLSDGAGTVLIQSAPAADALNLRIDWIDTASYAGEMEACMYAGAVKGEDGRLTGWGRLGAEARERQSAFAIKQDVKLLNEKVIEYTLEKPLQQLLARRRLKVADVDHFLPHYSSTYFRDRVAAGLAAGGPADSPGTLVHQSHHARQYGGRLDLHHDRRTRALGPRRARTKAALLGP